MRLAYFCYVPIHTYTYSLGPRVGGKASGYILFLLLRLGPRS